jgi:hypothetical protein
VPLRRYLHLLVVEHAQVQLDIHADKPCSVSGTLRGRAILSARDCVLAGLRVTLACAVHAKTHAYAQTQSQTQRLHWLLFITTEPITKMCGTYTKLCAWGEGDGGLRTYAMRYDEQRLVWGLVCPSRFGERMGKVYCVKGGWREEGEIVKERAWCLACPCA